MGRPKKPDPLDQAQRLAAVKIMVRDMGGAMPTMAKELRRNACETLDDIIGELTGPARAKAAKDLRNKLSSEGAR